MAVEDVARKNPSFLKSFTAGGMGGVACLCVGHPLDTIKVIKASRARGFDLVLV